jgi:hypothetical protein
MTNSVDYSMYEFVAQSCFENSTAPERFEWLDFNVIPPGRGRGPDWLSRATNEVAGRFVNEDFESRELSRNFGSSDA